MDDAYNLTHLKACVSAFSPLASRKKLASILFKTAMVVAFNDATYGQLNFLQLRLSLCPPWQVVLNSSARATRYLSFALRNCELLVLPIDVNR